MFLRKLFPYAFVGCLLLVFSAPALAQSTGFRPPEIQSLDYNEVSCSPDDFALAAATEEQRAAGPLFPYPVPRVDRFRQLVTAAIDERLGSRYRWGGTGPNGFDCSGFVWSVFQSAGINFERGSARALWGQFEAPGPEEKYKFGTLVFFSNLAHVGVVADEKGFYHASRQHGVIYSPFSDYWVSRIDGFRRIPSQLIAVSY